MRVRKARNVFIYGLSAKTGGGRSILNNYLSLLKASDPFDKYFVLTPSVSEYKKYAGENILLVEVPRWAKFSFTFLGLYHIALPRLLAKLRIDIIFNLGDVVIPTVVPQLYLFDWPYAVYPRSVAWKRMDVRSLLARRIKLFYFARYLRFATKIITQTNTMDQRLRERYQLANTVVVPNAVSIDNLSGGDIRHFDLPTSKTKFLYLTHYYSHKNIEIFLVLAEQFKSRSLPFCLVTTVGVDQHPGAVDFLRQVRERGLQDVIINVGPVRMSHVPSLYSQCDALLMPTLMESFSGTYAEAMFHRKTIFTSALDFAEDVCGEEAYYFDPLSVDSILEAIDKAFSDEGERKCRLERSAHRLQTMPTWNDVFLRYQELLGSEV